MGACTPERESGEVGERRKANHTWTEDPCRESAKFGSRCGCCLDDYQDSQVGAGVSGFNCCLGDDNTRWHANPDLAKKSERQVHLIGLVSYRLLHWQLRMQQFPTYKPPLFPSLKVFVSFRIIQFSPSSVLL